MSLETKGTTMQDIVEALLEKRVQDRPMSEHIFDGAAFECEAVTKTDFPEVKADATKVAAAAATTSSRRKSLRVASAAAALAPATRLKLVTLEDFKTYVTRSDHQNVFSGTVVADLFRR